MAGYPNPNSGGVKNGNGKRERTDQEDDGEFMPLSKRINNIHLSPERLINHHHQLCISNQGHPVPTSSSSVLPHLNNHSSNLGYMHPSQYPQVNSASNGYAEDHSHHLSSYEQQAHEFQNRHMNLQHHLHHHPHSSDVRGTQFINGVIPTVPVSAESLNSIPSLNYQISHDSHVPAADSGGSNTSETNIQYRPALNQRDNPHYYEANRTLFDLYIERMSRQNQSPHPNVFIRPTDLH